MAISLLMELTGESRETQVQPPAGAWEGYFGVRLTQARRRSLRYLVRNGGKRGARFIGRPVVLHHHTGTIEIPDLPRTRPALIRFRRIGRSKFEYFIYLRGTRAFEHGMWALTTFPNPLRTRGRRWLVL